MVGLSDDVRDCVVRPRSDQSGGLVERNGEINCVTTRGVFGVAVVDAVIGRDEWIGAGTKENFADVGTERAGGGDDEVTVIGQDLIELRVQGGGRPAAG